MRKVVIQMGFYVFRKWYFKDATSKWNAIELLRKAQELGTDKKHFEGEWAKEEEPRGWFSGLKKQLGKK
jgi:hypothetical protein